MNITAKEKQLLADLYDTVMNDPGGFKSYISTYEKEGCSFDYSFFVAKLKIAYSTGGSKNLVKVGKEVRSELRLGNLKAKPIPVQFGEIGNYHIAYQAFAGAPNGAGGGGGVAPQAPQIQMELGMELDADVAFAPNEDLI